jgi:sortase (surface protein transpeptidase)
VFLISMVALVASLFMPVLTLTASDAAAQGDPPNCDPGFVVDTATNTCVEDTGQATETSTATETEVTCPEGTVPDGQGGCAPDTSQQVQASASLQIAKFDCPPIMDWSQATYPDLQQNCAPNQIPVSISVATTNNEGSTETITSGFTWGPLLAGQAQIAETVNPGYDVPWIACSDTGAPNTASRTASTTWPLTDNTASYCEIYNIPLVGSVTIYKWQCDEGTEPGRELAYYEGSLPDQQTGPCETEHLNLPISLVDAYGSHDTTTQANGTQFGGVVPDANGQVQVFIQEPDGFGDPMVFCGTLDQPTQQPVTATGGQIALTPGVPPFDIQCNWYNIPAQQNSITIYKWLCEPGTQYGQPLEYYQGSLPDQQTGPCEQEHLNIPIHLIHGGPQQDTTTQANGTQFDDVVLDQTGSFQVWIEEPADFGDPMVFCATLDQDTMSPVTVTDGRITITPTGQPFTWQCNWYNLPGTVTTTGTTGQIVIEKYWCPEGDLSLPQDPTRADYQAACGEQPTTGANFSLTGPAAAPQTWPDMQPSGAPPQSFTWPDLPAGDYTIAENGLGGGWAPVVYCHASNGQTNGVADGPAMTGPSVTQTLQGGYTIDCAWFNIPAQATGNSVTIYKWQCEPGTMSGQSLDYYQGGLPDQETGPCETQHLNIPISLIDGNGNHDTTTQSDGTSFDNVVLDQNGAFSVTITEPTGYGEPMVFCGTLDDETQTAVTATGGTISITPAAEPFTYQCNWYNIPTGEGGYQLDLYKFTCAYTVDRSLGLPDLGSNPDCKPAQGVSFIATFGNTPGSAAYTGPDGQLSWVDQPGGPWSLTEGQMSGYDAPKVFCGPPQSGETPEVPVTNLTVTGTLDQTTPHIVCTWFNFEQQTTNGRITVYKFQCPPGTTSTDFGVLQESCTTPHNGIDFTLAGNGTSQSASTASGAVDWMNLDNGTYTATETTMLPGYGAPLVWCGNAMQDGVQIDPASMQWTGYPVTNSAIQLAIDNPPQRIVCYWYNFPTAPGEVTIYKWTCPAGYDLSAWGADPKADCTQATNGVTFTLDQPMGVDLQTNTGDSIDGAVYFGGLNPGAYTVTETVPANTASVFVLDCTGTDIPKVHQIPLSWGNSLDINVAGGDKIVCQWYNVPAPQKGWVTVTKYVCTTTKFVDKVYCQVYEKGQSIELFQVNGNVWKGVGITSAGGTYTWKDLDPGAYTIREHGMVPCKMTASSVDGKGNASVVAGKGTMINVYNCTATPGKVPPGKVPTKYPNTGVPPEGASGLMPAMQGDATGTPSAEDEAASEAFYRVDCVSGSVDTGTPVPPTPEADATMPPIEAEPTEAAAGAATTPEPPATPEVAGGGCERGAIPQHLTIESIGVDADVEYLEIVDGLMEQPTGPDKVAWYKDTAHLGERNNVVIAGHLNWWNVPEGVFYRLQDMLEGDRIEVTGDDGQVYIYEVRSVTQESNLEPPGIDVIGPTDEPTLTLITCGGDWNADIAEYDHRTVVRAVQVDVQPADTGGA